MPQIGSTSWPRARPTLIASAARWIATRRTPSFVRTSAEPRPERPARPFAMQFTESFDHRSPQRFVVTFVGATSHMIFARRSARSVTLPSCSPILKPIVPVVGADGVARLVHAGADGDDGSEAPLASGHRGHALVVDAVLEIDDDAVGLLQVLEPEGDRPLRVVRLHGDEDGVERLRHRLQLVDPERAHGDRGARRRCPRAAARPSSSPRRDPATGRSTSRRVRPWSASRRPRCRSRPTPMMPMR